MGCACGGQSKEKGKSFTRRVEERKALEAAKQMQPMKLVQLVPHDQILTAPENLLTPRQLRIRSRHFRIQKRNARAEQKSNAAINLSEQIKSVSNNQNPTV